MQRHHWPCSILFMDAAKFVFTVLLKSHKVYFPLSLVKNVIHDLAEKNVEYWYDVPVVHSP